MRALLLVLLLSGCVTMYPSGESLSVKHGAGRFGAAVESAAEYCGGMGLRAKHVGSDRLILGKVVSRFECVAK